MNIIARKPRNPHNTNNDDYGEFIVVDRGDAYTHQHGRFVSATANNHSLKNGEWFWGHYFCTLEEAIDHFNGRNL